MSIVVNDPDKLPKRILQIKLSEVSFISKEFMERMNNTNEQGGTGITRNNYYLVDTSSNVSWLQRTQELINYHQFLKLARIKGFTYIMLIK